MHCTAVQGIAVVELEARHYVATRSRVAQQQCRGALGRAAVCRAAADARFDSLEVPAQDDVHDAANGI